MSSPNRNPIQLDGRSVGRPLLFSPQLAQAQRPRAPRCPEIYMLGPDQPGFTLAELITALATPSIDGENDPKQRETHL